MFEYKGQQYSLQQLQDFASENNVEFDQYMTNMRELGMQEAENKQLYLDSDTFKKSNLPFVSTGANIINFFLASKDIAKDEEQQQQLGTYLKNRVDNIPESFQSALYSARQNYYDVYQSDFNIGRMDEEEQKRIRERAQNIILKDFENIKNLEFKDTGKGIVAGAREGDAASVIAGIFGAGVSMVETAIPAYFTGGLSLPIQVAAPMYTEYNKAKARQLYGDDPDAIEKLVNNNETEIAIPLALGTIATGLEYAGLKGVTKYIQSVPGKGGLITKLVYTGSGEGFTELGQLGIEVLNQELGGGKSIEEASKSSIDTMFSDEGLEMWLNGFLGSTQVSVGGRAINRALRNDNASVTDVKNKIDNLAKLNNQKYNTRNKKIKEALDFEIKEAEQDLKNYVNNKRKLSNVLTNQEKNSLVNILNKKDNIKKDLEDLKIELENNQISNREFGYAVRSLNNQDKKLSNQLTDIQSSAVGRAAEQTTETVKTFIQEGDLPGQVTEMTSDEISNIKEEGFDSKEAANQFGFIRQSTDGSFEIVLNKDKPMIGTAAHE